MEGARWFRAARMGMGGVAGSKGVATLCLRELLEPVLYGVESALFGDAPSGMVEMDGVSTFLIDSGSAALGDAAATGVPGGYVIFLDGTRGESKVKGEKAR